MCHLIQERTLNRIEDWRIQKTREAKRREISISWGAQCSRTPLLKKHQRRRKEGARRKEGKALSPPSHTHALGWCGHSDLSRYNIKLTPHPF